MVSEARILAFDLGAESGRAVMGLFDGEKLRIEDIHRFPTGGTRLLDTLYWDALRLFDECRKGLEMAVSQFGPQIESLGIDTWGVDFGLLDRDGRLLGNPRHYRDHANDGMIEAAFTLVPRERMFARTGTQFLQINSLYQLLSMKRANSPLLEAAHTLLFTPDLLNYWFTGIRSTEYSIASTSQMTDPFTRSWAKDLVTEMGLPAHILTDIAEPGTVLGPLLPSLAGAIGSYGTKVIRPGEHDTASAIAAVPAESADFAYLSSGTWSLLGIETKDPVVDARTLAANFTNEGGVCGTTRLLKNIMGLWLVQECRRSIHRKGGTRSYAELTADAEAAPAFGPLIDPDDTSFLAPDDMADAIRIFCLKTGQKPPETDGELIRCCLESLALKYRWVVEKLEEFRGSRISCLHIVGGGTQNRLLCRLAADALQREALIGPVEATATGNILMQAVGLGLLGSLEEVREVVRRSFPPESIAPQGSSDQWDEAYLRFLSVCN